MRIAAAIYRFLRCCARARANRAEDVIAAHICILLECANGGGERFSEFFVMRLIIEMCFICSDALCSGIVIDNESL